MRKTVPALVDILRHPDVQVRRDAAAALGRIGRPANAAIPELRRLARDNDPGARHEAELAIRNIEDR
jgi:HEAT repeat protein